MSKAGEMLVAVMNDLHDFSIVRDRHWYRIPVNSAKKWIKGQWPPKWISFYHTKVFANMSHSICYYSTVLKVGKAKRWQLFPERPLDENSEKLYYQFLLEPLKQLPRPIYSRRWRRIVFISTTWEKFIHAVEVNDLYHGSTLEDRLWAELKRLEIPAERQEFIRANNRNYFLDFAVYCAKGNLDIETDGDKWHHNPQIAPMDNLRNNDLATAGWHILRFTGNQIHDQMSNYCIPSIVEKINELGGVEISQQLYRRIDLKTPGSKFQYGLFDKH